jgi:hypothetical protein
VKLEAEAREGVARVRKVETRSKTKDIEVEYILS